MVKDRFGTFALSGSITSHLFLFIKHKNSEGGPPRIQIFKIAMDRKYPGPLTKRVQARLSLFNKARHCIVYARVFFIPNSF